MSALVVPARQADATRRDLLPAAAFTLTAVRVPVGLIVLASAIAGLPLLGATLLVLFVALDVADGVVARSGDSDDAYRRGFDSIVDRTVVAAFFFVVALHVKDFLPVAAVIAIASLVSLPFAITTWRRHQAVLKAPEWHRCWSLSLFLAGLLYFAGKMSLSVAAGAVGATLIFVCSVSLVFSHLAMRRTPSTWIHG